MSGLRPQGFESPRCRVQCGVLAQLEACVLSKDEVLGSKPRYSIGCVCSHGLVGYDARLTRERSRVRASVRIFLGHHRLRTDICHRAGPRSKKHLPVSLVGQDTRFSPWRPGFESRTGSAFFCLLYPLFGHIRVRVQHFTTSRS